MEITLSPHLMFSILKLQEQLNKVREEKTELELPAGERNRSVQKGESWISIGITYRLNTNPQRQNSRMPNISE